MRRYFLLLLVSLPLICHAQRFKGGVMLGLNASQIDGDSLSGYNKAGLMGGAFVYTEFSDKWGAQLELRYSGKGSAAPKSDEIGHKFKLQYIEMPILGKFNLFPKIELQFGISLGYLFSAKEDLQDGSGYQKLDESPSNFEIAALGGFNVTYLDPLFLNLRFSYSILPVYEDYPGASYRTGAWYNNVITLGVYYRIGGK